jgi:hypothetical protein
VLSKPVARVRIAISSEAQELCFVLPRTEASTEAVRFAQDDNVAYVLGFRTPSHSQSLAYNRGMANLTLVYGLRLLPSDEVTEVGAATIKLKNGRDAHVTMHVLEGSKDEIEKQLKTSLAAFFDIYPEI